MKIKKLLKIIESIADQKGYSKPFLCGGLVRDKYRDVLKDISDIDITNGDKSIFLLATDVSDYLRNQFKTQTNTAKDGHKSIAFSNMKLDFSSNFNHPNIENLLIQKNIQPTDMLKEMYSRDFTCNAMLASCDFKTIFDPTKSGKYSIDNKILIPPIDAVTSFHDDKRLVRAIYLSAKLNFNLNEDCIAFLRETTMSVGEQNYLKNKLNEAFDMNPKKTIEILNVTKMWDKIPVTEKLYPYYKNREK